MCVCDGRDGLRWFSRPLDGAWVSRYTHARAGLDFAVVVQMLALPSLPVGESVLIVQFCTCVVGVWPGLGVN